MDDECLTLQHPARRETPWLFAEHGVRGRKAGRATDHPSWPQDPCAESGVTAVAGRGEAVTSTELVVSQNRPDATPTAFDYSALAPNLAEEMRDRADRIHNIRRASVLDVGREFIAAKEVVEHGFFRDWVKIACQMNIRSAERAMQAAALVEKNDNLSYLPPDGLLTLASRSAPQAVVHEIIEEISAGERPSAVWIKRRITDAIKAEKRAGEALRAGEFPDVQACEHGQPNKQPQRMSS